MSTAKQEEQTHAVPMDETVPETGDPRPVMVLHIGPHKTGTKSIQGFFESVPEALAAGGFTYPTTGIINGQHAGIPGAYMARHHSLPVASLAAADDPVPALREEVGPDLAPILSSEVFWELLSYHPERFEELYEQLSRDWDVIPVYLRRDGHEKAWSAVKHLGRVNLLPNPLRQYIETVQLNEQAEQRLLELHPNAVCLDYTRDTVGTIIAYLREIAVSRGAPAEQLAALDRLGGEIWPARRAARENASLGNVYAPAVTIIVTSNLPWPVPKGPIPNGLVPMWEKLFASPGGGWDRLGLPTDRELGERFRAMAAEPERPAESALFSREERQAVFTGLASWRTKRTLRFRHRASLAYALEAVRSSLD